MVGDDKGLALVTGEQTGQVNGETGLVGVDLRADGHGLAVDGGGRRVRNGATGQRVLVLKGLHIRRIRHWNRDLIADDTTN